MSKFQIITIVIFIAFIITGVIFFATYKGHGGSSNALPPITVWGTFPAGTLEDYITYINRTQNNPIALNYIQKDPGTFSQEFIAALARGTGPDAILIPADMIVPHLDKITLIPYSALPERTFKDTYIQEGEIYLTSAGVEAIPFVIDPLIMYWNRDTFAAAGLPTYPKYWEEFPGLNHALTNLDANGNIRKTTLAMGDFTNVSNARELLGSLILQSNNSITGRDSNNGGIVSKLKSDPRPDSALSYFVQFADPNSQNYSWNRSLPDSKTAFLSGMLATYFGFASEIKDLRDRNPNLNFDAAPLPQWQPAGANNANTVANPIKATYGRMYGFSILKSSPNQNTAYQVIALLDSPAFLSELSSRLYLPPVRRDLIASGSSDPYITIFDKVALVAKTWLDADPTKSFTLFGNMVNAVTSGAKSVGRAIDDTSDQYDVILRQATQ